MSSWLDLLRAEVAASSIAAAARRIGVSRPALSQVLNACGPYGTGRASVAGIADKVSQALGCVTCPFLSELKGETVLISRVQCRRVALKVTAPLNSPRELKHWRACQTCGERPRATAGVGIKRVIKKSTKRGRSSNGSSD